MRLRLFFLLLLVQQIVVSAKEVKFGKVSKEEVSATQHAMYPWANAAILHKNEWVRYNYQYETGWSLVREVHYRIKIYNREGFDWATLQVPLYAGGNNREDISGVKGFTFNIVDGKVVDTKLKNDGVFIEEVNEYRNKASITMPEVKEGSVLDIEYKIVSPMYWSVDEFKFQYNIPVDYAQVRLEIPEYFLFKQYSRGFHPIKFDQSQENRSMNVSYRSSDQMGRLGRTTHKSGTLNFEENVYTMKVSNVPALLDEKYTSNIDNFRSSIKFELASTRFPNKPFKNYSLTWEDVAKSIYDYDSFGGELNRKNYFDNDVDQIIQGLSSDSEKAMALFQFVKTKMNWDNFVGVGCSSQGIRKAYKEGKGNVAEINLMLTAMLRYAGLNANPVLVSTRSNGIPLFPTSDGFNYVVSGLQLDNGLILLDATEKNAFPDVLPMRALNWFGRLIREDGTSREVNLMPKTKSLDAIVLSVDLNEDGSIQGRCRQQYTANNAFIFRENFGEGSEDTYLDELEKRYGDLEISDFELQNQYELSKPIVQTFTYTKESAYEKIAGKLYLSPLFHLTTSENPFKTEKREFPVDYGYPWADKYIITINIPEGYAVESVPEPIAVALPENLGQFKYNISAENNMINARVETELNTPVIPADYYLDLKEFYAHIIKKEAEKVILTKL
ncbi:transglutaminase domain-containing protein [Allomuricauda ruestringensis DSM 13258]|uniref:Transglutaminase domain-containing protein n=1 Tax=Allomuricauda ruestringensis (strain DSM 13258 / CIP 107369 / LMG 19739 / B1) TaxID=886377 RepID=G2PKK4_ALLRU|nr:DUF3857 domain-containing protein [Allomuricauda ruestringensis]AEM71023.1 transglutaminase domain-containing protein [Allomuricauda ruestringensis DSM 13258]